MPHILKVRFHRGISTILGGGGFWAPPSYSVGQYYTSGYLGGGRPLDSIRIDIEPHGIARVMDGTGWPMWEWEFVPSTRWQIETWFQTGSDFRLEYKLVGEPFPDDMRPTLDLSGAIVYLSNALDADDLDACKLAVTNARRELVLRTLRGER